MGYFGSKATSGLCQPIIAMMPPHDTYIETHLGGGAIMKRKPAALHNIGIDLDGRALAAFDCDYPVQRVHGCAHRFLAEYDYRGSELVYSDPPYLMRTRTSGRRYRFDYGEADHVELLELLKTLPCQVMLSGYPSALYDELLGGWRSLELQVMNQGGVRTEKLWFNFVPDRVHWASRHTIESYALCYRLLVVFAAERHRVRPCQLALEQLDLQTILDFLDHLERARGNAVRTRNARLVAIKSFFRFLEFREPGYLDLAGRVRAIPRKRGRHR